MDGVNNNCKILPNSDIDDVNHENCSSVTDESSMDQGFTKMEENREMEDCLDIHEEPNIEEQNGNIHVFSSTYNSILDNVAENEQGYGEDPSEEYEVVDKKNEKKTDCKILPNSHIDDVYHENCSVTDESLVDLDFTKMEENREMEDCLDIPEEPNKEEQNLNIFSSACTSILDNVAENEQGYREDPSEQHEVVVIKNEKKTDCKILPKSDTMVLKPSQYEQASNKRGNSSETSKNAPTEDTYTCTLPDSVNLNTENPDGKTSENCSRPFTRTLDDVAEYQHYPPETLVVRKICTQEEERMGDGISKGYLENNSTDEKEEQDPHHAVKTSSDFLEDILKEPESRKDVDNLEISENKGKLSMKSHQTKSEKKGLQYWKCMCWFGFLLFGALGTYCRDLKVRSLDKPVCSVEVFVYAVGFYGPAVLPPDLAPDGPPLPSPDLPGLVRAAVNVGTVDNQSGASRMEVPQVERAAGHIREGNDRTSEERRMCHIADTNYSGVMSDRAGLEFISLRNNQVTISIRQERNQSDLPLPHVQEEDGETKQTQSILTVEDQYRQQRPNTGTRSQAESDRLPYEEIMGRQTILLQDGQQSTLPATSDTVHGRNSSSQDNTRQDTESGLSSWLFDLTQFSLLPDVSRDMLEHSARANTFMHNWPHHYLSGEQMAHAGLFFTGCGDKTRCYFCGICIDGWQEGDDPLQEHIKLSKECIFAFGRWQCDNRRNRLRDRTVTIGVGGQQNLDAEGATANEILMCEIEEKEADDPGSKKRRDSKTRWALERHGHRGQPKKKRHPYPELTSHQSMIGNGERTGAHQLGRNDACSRRAASRERVRSQRQTINSDQTTERSVSEGQPNGAQSTVRAHRNDLDNREESQGLAGSHSLFGRIEQFLHSSDGRQLMSEGYTVQHIACAIEAYSFHHRIAGDEPITICTVRLALQSLCARPKRRD